MKFIDKRTIEINRELSDLDRFTIDFINILSKYTDYVIVSGYVAILLGRARASEDIDVIIKKIDFQNFTRLYNELKKNYFYCLNAEKEKTVYSYLKDNLAVRFAKIDTMIPNIEMKWTRNEFDKIALEKTIKVKIQKDLLRISHLELQIAFKEEILKSPKDLDDANHIREVAKDYLDEKLIQKYKEMLHGFY
ncbi:MAG: hypothetical protein JXA91_00790 [Candidatus Thermoplasmatota archaeon]|nr:hypothetical protein [Candidatus Thermoplasmatota archaeon]